MSIIESVFNRIGIVADFFFEEPEVARYITFTETLSGITLPDPNNGINDRHFTPFDAPGLINGSFPILFFTTRHEGRPRIQVRLNSPTLILHTFEDNGLRTWHKFIPPGALVTQFNQLILSVQGEGSVTFADMFILYKSNEITVRKPIVLTQT